MEHLPETLPILDPRLRSAEAPPWHRVKAGHAGLVEADWDRVIVEQATVLADALSAANVIGADAKLRFLGQQIDSVDVLMAEVDGDDLASFRRLVLVEDKLLKNTDAKRKVLAQIVEYSERARAAWRFEELRANPKLASQGDWLDRNRTGVEHSLRQGDFLLVIAGDGIDENLQRLVRRFAAQHDPLNLSELCLVSMAVYARGDERLFVPHVVSAVQLQQRELAIRVVVESPDGVMMPARVERVTSQEAAATTATPERPEVTAFLARLKASLDGEMSEAAWLPSDRVRKRLSYNFSLDAQARSVASLAVHFGPGMSASWSPIRVGLEVGTTVEGLRERLEAKLRRAVASGSLLAGTKVRISGKQNVEAVVALDWRDPNGLDDALFEQVISTFRTIRSGVEPIIGTDARPEIVPFLREIAATLDPEMRDAGWSSTDFPRKTIEYAWSDEDWEVFSFQVHIGADDPVDWSLIQVGAYGRARKSQKRDACKAVFDALISTGVLPKATRVEAFSKREVSALVSFDIHEPVALDASMRERVIAAFRKIRSAIEPALGFDVTPSNTE